MDRRCTEEGTAGEVAETSAAAAAAAAAAAGMAASDMEAGDVAVVVGGTEKGAMHGLESSCEPEQTGRTSEPIAESADALLEGPKAAAAVEQNPLAFLDLDLGCSGEAARRPAE